MRRKVLARAILCNWLVNMALFQAAASNSVPGKFLGVQMPITAFVTLVSGVQMPIAAFVTLVSYVLGQRGSVMRNRQESVPRAFVREMVAQAACEHVGMLLMMCRARYGPVADHHPVSAPPCRHPHRTVRRGAAPAVLHRRGSSTLSPT